MKIVKRNKDGSGPIGRLMCDLDAWDKTFYLNGHTYVIIAKGESEHTQFKYTNGHIPVMNLKSRIIIAISDLTVVQPLNCIVESAPHNER